MAIRLIQCLLTCLLSCSCVIASAVERDSTNPPAQSRFFRTALQLGQASPEEIADFASTALTLLAQAYQQEAKLAQREAVQAGGDKKLLDWSRAVQNYSAQLSYVLADIELGLPVVLVPQGEKFVALEVADRMTILSHPRGNQQSVLEQQILQSYCARHDCVALLATAAHRENESVPHAVGPLRPQWTFDEDGSACAYRGFQLRFAPGQNLAAARQFCRSLVTEIFSLIDELRWQQRHGVTIDWSLLQITTTPYGSDHQVLLNAAGDSVLRALPRLGDNPALIQTLSSWLALRVAGKARESIEVDAENLVL